MPRTFRRALAIPAVAAASLSLAVTALVSSGATAADARTALTPSRPTTA